MDTSPFAGTLIDQDVDSHRRRGDKKSMPHPDRCHESSRLPSVLLGAHSSPKNRAVAQIACSPPPGPVRVVCKYSDLTDLGGGYSLFPVALLYM